MISTQFGKNKKMEKKKEIISISLVFIFLISEIIMVIGLILYGNGVSYGNTIAYYCAGVAIIEFLLLCFGGLFYFVYLWIKGMFESKNWYRIIEAIFIILSVILFVSGTVITFLGTSFDGIYKVDYINVIDVRNSKILVDSSKYYDGDGKIIEIHKPFFTNIKEGELIKIRYPINNPEKMSYVIDGQIGAYLLVLGVELGFIIVMLNTFIKIILIMKKQRENEKYYFKK